MLRLDLEVLNQESKPGKAPTGSRTAACGVGCSAQAWAARVLLVLKAMKDAQLLQRMVRKISMLVREEMYVIVHHVDKRRNVH